MLKAFNLHSDPAVYAFTKEGAATAVSPTPHTCSLMMMIFTLTTACFQTSNNDRVSHKAVMSALVVIGFSEDEIRSIYQVLASILHLVKAA